MNTLMAIGAMGILLVFIVGMIYSVGLQKRGSDAQAGGLDMVRESMDLQERSIALQERSIVLEEKSLATLDAILEELQKGQ
jgi:hypothetical protein